MITRGGDPMNIPYSVDTFRNFKNRKRKPECLLVIIIADQLAGFGIDYVDGAAGEARHGLVAVVIAVVRIVGDPALYVQVRVRAAVEECGHKPS